MSKAEIVRLVRCPKCQNLLPELAGYSAYQCGGCGAVLRARVKQDAEVLDGKADEDKLGACGKLGDLDLSGKAVQENVKSSPEEGVARSHCVMEDLGSDSLAFGPKENNGVKKDKYQSEVKVDPYSSPGISKVRKIEKRLDGVGNVSMPQESEHVSHWRGEISGQYGNFRDGNEGGRPLHLNYQEDGPSNYISDSSCNNCKPRGDASDLNVPKTNGSLQKDRVDLLQMMEELSHQLRRSGNLGEKMKDISPMNQDRGCNRSSTSAMFNNNVAGPSAGMHEHFMPDKPTISTYHDPHYPPQNPHGGRRRNGVSNPHHFPYGLSDMPGYGNNFEMQTMRGTLPTPYHFKQQLPHPLYYPGQPFADDPAMYAPNSNSGLPHHPVCCFYNCCIDHHRAIPADYLDDTRFYDVHNNSMPYSRNIPSPSAQQGYNLRTSSLSSSLIDHTAQTRMTDKDKIRYTRAYIRQQQQKGKLAKVGLHCQPVASGAPFIICQGCSELLQLPKMTFKYNSKRQILCCGACNTVMVCDLINRKFTISISGESKKIVKGVRPRLYDLVGEGNSSELGWAKMNSVSDGFYSSSHESQTINGNLHVSTKGLDLTSNETQDSHSLPASSPASFEGVESMENLASLSPHDPHPQDQPGQSLNADVTNRVWKGDQSTRSNHETVMPKDMISRQNLLNETSATAEMEEVSFKDHSKTGVPKNLDLTTHRNDIEKTKGSSFAGVIKKSLIGLSRSNHSAADRVRIVTVNGYKIPERLMKKAEKLAGPIQPGNYWYDFRAGFWGVIGGPCLGILPACIEEFNFPMQANCSSGATGVFVNGRELQQIDLDLLASRGLPTARGRSYIIEISGKVVDKDSGEELDALGKLAPTIEKVKHGFGMKPHTQIVQ